MEKYVFTAAIDNFFANSNELKDYFVKNNVDTYIASLFKNKEADDTSDEWMYFKFTPVREGVNNNGQMFEAEDLSNTYKDFMGKAIDVDHDLDVKGIVGHIIDSKFYAANSVEPAKIECLGVIYKNTVAGKDTAYIVKQGYTNGYLMVSMEAKARPEFVGDYVKLKDIKWFGVGLTRNPADPNAIIKEVNAVKENEVVFSAEKEDTLVAIEVTENYIHIPKIEDISGFDKKSIRTITLSEKEGIKAIIGKRNGGNATEVISYLFDKSKWDLKSAKKWVEEHKASIDELSSDVVLEGSNTMNEESLSAIAEEIYEPLFEGKKLSYKEMEALPDDAFALVEEVDGKKVREFPIHDLAHARNALARLGQPKTKLTQEQRAKIWDKIKKKWGDEIGNMPEENPYKASTEDKNGGIVELETLKAEIETLKAEIETMKASLEEKDNQIKECKCKEKDALLEEYKGKDTEKDKVVSELTKSVEEKDAIIATLTSEKETLAKEVDSLKVSVSDVTKIADEKEVIIADLSKKVDTYQEAVNRIPAAISDERNTNKTERMIKMGMFLKN